VRKDWLEEWAGTEEVGNRVKKYCTTALSASAISQPLDKDKEERSVLTQIRTGKIGLADFLHTLDEC
jgi:hypothetical protein